MRRARINVRPNISRPGGRGLTAPQEDKTAAVHINPVVGTETETPISTGPSETPNCQSSETAEQHNAKATEPQEKQPNRVDGAPSSGSNSSSRVLQRRKRVSAVPIVQSRPKVTPPQAHCSTPVIEPPSPVASTVTSPGQISVNVCVEPSFSDDTDLASTENLQNSSTNTLADPGSSLSETVWRMEHPFPESRQGLKDKASTSNPTDTTPSSVTARYSEDRMRILKSLRLKKMMKEERKKEKPKCVRRHEVQYEVPLDPNTMTMRDLIYCLPDSNPMTSAIVQDQGEERLSLPASPRGSAVGMEQDEEWQQQEEDEDQGDVCNEEEMLAPRVRVAEDGSLVLDEESLTVRVKRPSTTVVDDSNPLFERGSTTTYRSFRKFNIAKPWSLKETDMFYLAISMVGTDFTLIGQLFPHRTRNDIKNKYKREERINSWRIDKAFNNRRAYDFAFFSSLLKRVLEKDKQESKIKKANKEGLNGLKRQRKPRNRISQAEDGAVSVNLEDDDDDDAGEAEKENEFVDGKQHDRARGEVEEEQTEDRDALSEEPVNRKQRKKSQKGKRKGRRSNDGQTADDREEDSLVEEVSASVEKDKGEAENSRKRRKNTPVVVEEEEGEEGDSREHPAKSSKSIEEDKRTEKDQTSQAEDGAVSVNLEDDDDDAGEAEKENEFVDGERKSKQHDRARGEVEEEQTEDRDALSEEPVNRKQRKKSQKGKRKGRRSNEGQTADDREEDSLVEEVSASVEKDKGEAENSRKRRKNTPVVVEEEEGEEGDSRERPAKSSKSIEEDKRTEKEIEDHGENDSIAVDDSLACPGTGDDSLSSTKKKRKGSIKESRSDIGLQDGTDGSMGKPVVEGVKEKMSSEGKEACQAQTLPPDMSPSFTQGRRAQKVKPRVFEAQRSSRRPGNRAQPLVDEVTADSIASVKEQLKEAVEEDLTDCHSACISRVGNSSEQVESLSAASSDLNKDLKDHPFTINTTLDVLKPTEEEKGVEEVSHLELVKENKMKASKETGDVEKTTSQEDESACQISPLAKSPSLRQQGRRTRLPKPKPNVLLVQRRKKKCQSEGAQPEEEEVKLDPQALQEEMVSIGSSKREPEELIETVKGDLTECSPLCKGTSHSMGSMLCPMVSSALLLGSTMTETGTLPLTTTHPGSSTDPAQEAAALSQHNLETDPQKKRLESLLCEDKTPHPSSVGQICPPREDNLRECLSEQGRVLKKRGQFATVNPKLTRASRSSHPAPSLHSTRHCIESPEENLTASTVSPEKTLLEHSAGEEYSQQTEASFTKTLARICDHEHGEQTLDSDLRPVLEFGSADSAEQPQATEGTESEETELLQNLPEDEPTFILTLFAVPDCQYEITGSASSASTLMFSEDPQTLSSEVQSEEGQQHSSYLTSEREQELSIKETDKVFADLSVNRDKRTCTQMTTPPPAIQPQQMVVGDDKKSQKPGIARRRGKLQVKPCVPQRSLSTKSKSAKSKLKLKETGSICKTPEADRHNAISEQDSSRRDGPDPDAPVMASGSKDPGTVPLSGRHLRTSVHVPCLTGSSSRRHPLTTLKTRPQVKKDTAECATNVLTPGSSPSKITRNIRHAPPEKTDSPSSLAHGSSPFGEVDAEDEAARVSQFFLTDIFTEVEDPE
uniref:Myb-like domain-containing protein n=1 Tax=Denticeps clupeoides TaxID=299321 RepID=A0AAY4C386_9TELE